MAIEVVYSVRLNKSFWEGTSISTSETEVAQMSDVDKVDRKVQTLANKLTIEQEQREEEEESIKASLTDMEKNLGKKADKEDVRKMGAQLMDEKNLIKEKRVLGKELDRFSAGFRHQYSQEIKK